MWPALAILGSGVLSAGAQIFGANKAAQTQSQAAKYATDAQLAMFGITRAGLQPFINVGSAAVGDLMGRPAVKYAPTVMTKGGKTINVNPGNAAALAMLKSKGFAVTTPGHQAVAARPGALNDLIKPISMTEADLVNTPGYKFTLGQGEKAVENAASARGLGISGAAIKGGAEFATGLADKTYQERFANALANKQMAWQALAGTAGLGETAAAGLGTGAIQTGANIGSNVIGAGNAQAGADIAGANAATGFGNSLVAALLQQQKLAGSGGGASGGVY